MPSKPTNTNHLPACIHFDSLCLSTCPLPHCTKSSRNLHKGRKRAVDHNTHAHAMGNPHVYSPFMSAEMEIQIPSRFFSFNLSPHLNRLIQPRVYFLSCLIVFATSSISFCYSLIPSRTSTYLPQYQDAQP